jgi:hypothetical protein
LATSRYQDIQACSSPGSAWFTNSRLHTDMVHLLCLCHHMAQTMEQAAAHHMAGATCAAYTAMLGGCVATPLIPAYFSRSTSTADRLSSVRTAADRTKCAKLKADAGPCSEWLQPTPSVTSTQPHPRR